MTAARRAIFSERPQSSNWPRAAIGPEQQLAQRGNWPSAAIARPAALISGVRVEFIEARVVQDGGRRLLLRSRGGATRPEGWSLILVRFGLGWLRVGIGFFRFGGGFAQHGRAEIEKAGLP
jgi:hypothetical protein